MKARNVFGLALVIALAAAVLCATACSSPTGSSNNNNGSDEAAEDDASDTATDDDATTGDDTTDGDGADETTGDDTDDTDDAGDNTPPDEPADAGTPTADAGEDVTIDYHDGTLVSLDGSGSSHSGDSTLTYSWSFTGRPEGSSLTDTDIADATQAACSFDVSGETADWSADGTWTYTLALTVTDESGNEDTDEVSVTIAGLGETSVIAE
jgi:hypothetical protein